MFYISFLQLYNKRSTMSRVFFAGVLWIKKQAVIAACQIKNSDIYLHK